MFERSSMPRSVFLILAILAVVPFVTRGSGVSAEVNDGHSGQYRPDAFTGASGISLPYRILTPKQLDPGKKYPLVLFLHGAGERGSDNKKQLVHAAADFASPSRMKQFPAFVVFPQCPTNQRWVESPWELPTGRGEFDSHPSKPMAAALELVDSLVGELPIDRDRLYVTGLSMGGQGAWFAAANKPHRFAAMLEVCGGGDPTWAADYAGIPIWALHGQDDGVVPISRAREMVIALTEAGHAPELRYTEYPGVGHNSWTQTFKRDDVFKWLFAQRKR
jgi:predicted peptidase